MTVDIVGRGEELAALLDLVEQAADGAAALVLEGEAGIGKSTLWLAGSEAASERGLRVLSARPAESEQGLAHAGLGDLLAEAAAEVLPVLSAPRRRALETALLLDAEGDVATDSRALAVGVHDALVALAAHGPLLLAIDDVQWLDPASADALSFALRRLDREPIRILLARRGDAPAALEPALPGVVERLSVGPLSVGAIQGLVRDRLGLRFPRPIMLRVHDASGGNPFFALELARTLDAGAAPLDAAQPLPVPASLEHLVGERLRALPEETRKALLVVAVTGSPALELLEAAGIDEETLAPAVAAEVVERANGLIRFTHPLLASAAIAEATVAERRTAHRLASLAADDPVTRARHVAAALEGEDAATARQLEEAVELARGRGAPWVAAELGEAAAQATPRTREVDRRRRIVQAARDHLAAGSASRALTLARELVEAARPGPPRAEALRLLADVENAIDVSTGVDRCRQALREPGLPPELELELHRELALGLRITEGLAAAEAHAQRAAVLAEQLGSDLLEARTLATLAVIRFNQGEPEAFALAERAVELALQVGDADTIEAATSAWGHCLLWSGRIAEARAVFEHALGSTAGNDEPAEASALWYLALAEERAGRLALARGHAERSRELMFQYAGHELDEPAAHMPLARIAAHQGDVELARELAGRAHVYAEAQGGMSTGRAALALLGTLDLWAGEPLRALERFEAYAEQSAAAGFSTSIAIHIADHVEALVEVGRTADALALLELWEADARKLGHHRAPPEIARCRGLVAASDGEIVRAIELLEAAVTLHEEAGDPFGRSRALLVLGITRRRARRSLLAREAIEAALAGFEEIGAAGWAEKARAELGSIGGRIREEGLTPAEQRVAALVAEGRTNREVAASLFLAERTVETHLSHVYAKLGIRSRTELARLLPS